MARSTEGLTTGTFYPNIPAPERAYPEYDDTYELPANTAHVPGQQPRGDNNPEGQIPGTPVASPAGL